MVRIAGVEPALLRHCEERSDEAIQRASRRPLGCFATLAMTASERALLRVDEEALDDVADPDLVVVVERHAAFLAGHDAGDIVLEPLQRLQLAALVDHPVVADEPDMSAALDMAVLD